MNRNRVLVALLGIASLVFYFAGQRDNPPSYHSDEASIAYNALTIARAGVDERGNPYPLYFEAFGDYKNPIYIYTLAAAFTIVPPSDLVARRLSAAAGWGACVILGLLAWRITQSPAASIMVFLMALLTPMLFEISRLVFEVAFYPLIVAAFLYATRVAGERPRWSAGLIGSLVATLLAVAYTYSIGRLLAPLLAGTLLFLYTRARRWQIAIVLAGVAAGMIPILAYNARHDGALTARFQGVTYVQPGAPLATMATFERKYVSNLLPLGFSLKGDPETRHHVPGSGGSLLLVTWFLAAAGAVRVWRDRWWRLVIAGTLLSVVPASLTLDTYHTLRLSAFAPFLLILCVPSLGKTGPALLSIVLALGLGQAAYFFHAFHRLGPERRAAFDFGVRDVVEVALAQHRRPIVIGPGMPPVHVYWYAAQAAAEKGSFLETSPPPAGAIVVARDEPPREAAVLRRAGAFTVYIAP
jgi:MFS family permease